MILTQLPVAFCGGNTEKTLPVPPAKPTIVPVYLRSEPYISETRRTFCPMRIFLSCTSRKLASTHISERGIIAIRESLGVTHCPTCTFLCATRPLTGEKILHLFSFT